MRSYVSAIAAFFRCSPNDAVALLDDAEWECLAVEALCSRAVRL